MLLLVSGMQFRIVGRLVGDHPEEDFEQSLAQASERAGVTHPCLTFFLIIRLTPDTGLAKTICPEMNGVAHEFIARPTHTDFIDLSGLIADGRGPGDALEDFVAAVAIGIGPNRRQQARSQDFFGPRQAAKQIVVGMLVEQGFDLLAVQIQLLAQRAQQLG